MVFHSGDVLLANWDERPMRVMMADEIEVFYDALAAEVGWNLVRAQTAIYYRTPTGLLRANSECIRTEPLTDSERARHRPDLPMRVLRNENAGWNVPLA